MKILLISTTVFPLPPQGYSGTEMLVYHLAEGLVKKGHQVTVVCPEGSRFTQNVEPIYTPVREEEEKSWLRYRGRLEAWEWEVILDATFQRWGVMSSAGRERELPIINWNHTSPTIYQSLPPVRYPMFVGLSRPHAEEMSRAWGCLVKYVHNGIDLELYKSNGQPKGERYLSIGRYTPEKGFLETISLAKRLRVGVDLYGDIEIIASPAYKDRCFLEADGFLARTNPGVSRDATVGLYSTHRGLLHLHRWNEPFSLVVLEAQACGCPPIAMRRGGPSELIRHGENGFLVDSDDEAAELIARDAVREINPETMRRWVEERFSLEVFVTNWEKLLLETAAGNRW